MVAEVGPWAKEKLDVLARYLDFYTKVLKNQPWRTLYIDAFAGGGRAKVRKKSDGVDALGLLAEPDPLDHEQAEFLDGSPKVALGIANPFSRYFFIEPAPKRGKELDELQAEFGEKLQITTLKMTAAEGIAWVTSQSISKQKHRGVAFLDPFGARLEWESVQSLAETGLFEVVVNFALNMAINRMLPNNGEVPSAWSDTLDRYFGSHEWFDEVYSSDADGLFGSTEIRKRENYSERLLQLYRRNLKAAFGHVSTPRLICNTRGAPLYHLLWAGPHKKGLEGANYILSMGERLNNEEIGLPLLDTFAKYLSSGNPDYRYDGKVDITYRSYIDKRGEVYVDTDGKLENRHKRTFAEISNEMYRTYRTMETPA